MKKLLVVFTCILISISLVSCNSYKGTNNKDNSISSIQTTNANDETVKNDNKNANTSKPLDDGTGIEKVKLSFFNSTQESAYDEAAKKLIENIKDCKDNKGIELAEKIGTMSIKYSNDEEFSDIANLYLGADNSVYAKNIDNSNKESKYAYRIDLDKLK